MSTRYAFGRFEVRPDERRVLEAGEPVGLGGRAFDLLLALIANRDRVIAKQELLELVWPRTFVEESNLAVQISALRRLLGAEAISTVAGRGYRFTLVADEVRPTSITPAAGDRVDLPLPDKPSIAVLPLANVGGDPEQEYFTDGVTEDIITELSRFQDLFVIARNTMFTYKGRTVDVRKVALEVGVRYVVEGSIRKAGNRVRVTAQLIDASTAAHIWAEKFDRVLDDVFAVQEEVTRSIVAAIAPQIEFEERSRAARRRPGSLTAHDLAFRAAAHGSRGIMNTDLALIERALAEAREALALDSACVRALYCIAVCQTSILSLDGVAGPDAGRRWQEGVKAAGRLIELDPSGSVGYAWMGVLQSMARRSVEALSYARRAREINCNDAAALVQLALVELWGGQPELALEHANQAIRLNPRDPRHYSTNAIRAGACFLLRRHVEGQEYAIQSAAAAPNYPFAHLMRALTAVGIGDIPMAKAAMDTARRLSPDLVRGRLEGESPYHHVDGASPTTLAWRIAAGLEDPGAAASLR